MDKKEYYVGLDIGTNSVGYAVTDTNYNLIRAKGQDLWGANLFEEGITAKDRRTFRVARRMLQRRRKRIEWLQKEFFAEVATKDPAFFERLRESKFLFHDKKFSDSKYRQTKSILFSDKNYKDKDFYKKYPTIYHLRKAQIENDKDAFDIRMLYLTIHHIFKHRGHFLYGNIDINNLSLKDLFDELIASLDRAGYASSKLNELDVEYMKECLADERISGKEKQERIIRHAGFSTKDKFENNILSLIVGLTVNASFLQSDDVEEKTRLKVSAKEDLDAKKDELLEVLGEDCFDIIVKCKAIYDFSIVDRIVKDSLFLSFLKVNQYEKHRHDLKLLKKTFEDLNLDITPILIGKNSYEAYVKHLDKKSKQNAELPEFTEIDDFYKKIQKQLDGYDNSDVKYILSEISNNSFLPKQSYVTNSVIPYQLHKAELEKILKNASIYHPFLKEIDDSGLCIEQKILKTFEFRIPYFVGPLNDRSEFSWIIRRDAQNREHIYPWNFEEIVDIKASAEGFCNRLIGQCTYLKQCRVLPRESLLYSKYCVLNEINNIAVNNIKLTPKVKQEIFNNVCLINSKVTSKTIKEYLVVNGFIDKEDSISGIDSTINSTLKSYITVGKILGRDFYLNSQKFKAVEDIISRATLFANDHAMVKDYIKEKYSALFSEDEITRLSRLSFTGWGNLSKDFLYLKDSEDIRLIDYLWITNNNLMQVINQNEDYKKELALSLNNCSDLSIDEYLDQSYASPSIKRSIRQASTIVDTIVQQIGYPPSKIFVEVTRAQEPNKGRTKTRKMQLTEAFKQFKADGSLREQMIGLLNTTNDADLKKEKLYLYFLQMGKCMYSGDAININMLYTNDYQIEHIYPQSKFPRQDGLDNKVLVKSIMNQEKRDNLLSKDIQERMKPFWIHLNDCGLLTKAKLTRLCRTQNFDENEVSSFIDAQLVETSQSVKLVSQYFKNIYKDTVVVYSKAKFVSDFRKKQQVDAANENKDLDLSELYGDKKIIDPIFVKTRLLNDTHHAKDAYLNIVVGNVYYTAFNKNFYLKDLGGFEKATLFNHLYSRTIKSGKDIAWDHRAEGTIAIVRKTMQKNSAYISRKKVEGKGQILKQFMSKGKGNIPFKNDERLMKVDENQKLIYGGYKQSFIAFYCLFEKRKTKERVLFPIEIKDVHVYSNDRVAYVSKKYNLQNDDIIIINPKILINSIFLYKGVELVLIGKTNNNIYCGINFQIYLPPKWNTYIRSIEGFVDFIANNKISTDVNHHPILNKEINLNLYEAIINKIKSTKLANIMSKIALQMESGIDLFHKASLKEQCLFIDGVLSYLKRPTQKVDLSLLGGSPNAGQITVSMSNLAKCEFVHRNIIGTVEYKK